jgi:hypothetical protein
MAVISCADNANGVNETNDTMQQTTDGTALEAIDSSAIINDSTRLPQDSTAATVTH